MGAPQRIAVHPRLLALHPLPTGISRHLEGPSSDTSPQGTVTFHRLREYVVGDDLRTVHWPSTAHAGKLVVRHNVDTAQPYTVVLADLDPDRYSAETFEEAIDVTASLVMSMSVGKAPVQLRTDQRRPPRRSRPPRPDAAGRLPDRGQPRTRRGRSKRSWCCSGETGVAPPWWWSPAGSTSTPSR